MRVWQKFTTVSMMAFAACCLQAETLNETRKPIRHPYRTAYRKKVFGPPAAARVVAGAALSQRKGSFAHKLAIGAVAHVAGGTTKYAVAAARHEDLHCYKSEKKGFGPRLRHALLSTVVTRKTTTGKKTAAAGNVSGAAVAGLVASSAATGGIALGADAGGNVVREFWPRKKRSASPTAATRRAPTKKAG